MESKPTGPKRKERFSFRCDLGAFEVVANAKFVQSMSDERDDAKERCGEAEKYGFEAVEAIDTLGGANGGTGGPNYVKWTDAEPFGALTLRNTIDLYERAFCDTLNMVTNIHHPAGYVGFGADPPVSLFQTTFAFEALTGGTLAPLPETWDGAALAEAQRVERLILGDAKADLAAKLTAGERAQLKGLVVGVRSMARVLSGVRHVKHWDGKSSYDRLTNRVDGEAWCEHVGTQYANQVTSELRASLQPGLAPALYTLLFTPDERPLLAYKLARELYDHHAGDYEATDATMRDAIAYAWGERRAVEANTQRATERLEDSAVPLEDRLVDLHAWLAERARKAKRESEECATRWASESYKARKQTEARAAKADRQKRTALRDQVRKTIQKRK
jgi:hypothetical protein